MRVLQFSVAFLAFAYLASLSHGWPHIAAMILAFAVPLAVVVGLVVGRRV